MLVGGANKCLEVMMKKINKGFMPIILSFGIILFVIVGPGDWQVFDIVIAKKDV
jgi:hypothetical protein